MIYERIILGITVSMEHSNTMEHSNKTTFQDCSWSLPLETLAYLNLLIATAKANVIPEYEIEYLFVKLFKFRNHVEPCHYLQVTCFNLAQYILTTVCAVLYFVSFKASRALWWKLHARTCLVYLLSSSDNFIYECFCRCVFEILV